MLKSILLPLENSKVFHSNILILYTIYSYEYKNVLLQGILSNHQHAREKLYIFMTCK